MLTAAAGPGISRTFGVYPRFIETSRGYYLTQTMPNLQVIELQGQRHGLPGDCRPRLVGSFLEDPYARVDDDCVDDLPLGPWIFE